MGKDNSIDSLEFLHASAYFLAQERDSDQLYKYIGNSIQRLMPKAYVIINEIDIDNGVLRINSVNQPNDLVYSKVVKLLGWNLLGKVLPLDNTILDLSDGHIKKFDKGLRGLSFGFIPENVAKSIEKIIALDQIYGIAFVVDQKPYANAICLLPKGVQIVKPELIEAFIGMASIALKRIKSEQNEDKFRTLFQHMPQGAFIQNKSGQLLDVNDAFLDIFDMSREDFLNTQVVPSGYLDWEIYDQSGRLLNKDDIPAFQVIKTGKPVVHKIVKLKNIRTNSVKWVDVTAVPKFTGNDKKPNQAFVTMHDITQMVEGEEKLLLYQKHLDMLLSNTPAVIYTYEVDSLGQPNITYINDNVKTVLGYGPQTYIDNIDYWKSCVHPEDLPKLLAKITGKESEHEYRFQDKYGNYRWLYDRQKILKQDDKKTEIIGSWWDITEKKQSEQLLHYLKEMQQLLTTLANEFINVQPEKVDLAINDMLKTVGEFTGVARMYVFQHDFKMKVTSNTHEWCSEGITPFKDDLQQFPMDLCQEIIETHNKGEALYYPDVSNMSTKDPMKSVFEQQGIKSLIMIPLLQEGMNIGFVGFDQTYKVRHFTDEEISVLQFISEIISNALLKQQECRELRKSELRYRALFDQSNDAVFILDLAGNHLDANQRASEMLGYTKDEILKLSVREISAEVQKSHQIINLLKDGEHIPPFERKFIRKDGNIIEVEISVELINDDDGKPIHIQSVVRDITDRKKAEKVIMAEKARAEQAEEAKSSFLAKVSHEIRNPLNVILGFSGILSEKLSDSGNKKIIDAINASGKHLLSVINEVLDWSKIESDQIALNDSPVSMDALVEELSILFQEASHRKKLKFNISIAPDFPEIIEIDGVRLRQVLHNLIGNAIKFTDEGEVKVDFGFLESKYLLGSLHVEVSDTGIGIPQHEQGEVFKPFVQIGHQRENNLKGTGLGLSISKEIIEKMNGRITVESYLNEGSVFKIDIPDVHIIKRRSK